MQVGIKMEIGKLLKNYRTDQGKTKKEWSKDVISPSFYARVENGTNRISAEDLLNLLQSNHISITSFFNKLSPDEHTVDEKERQINRLIHQAYYKNSKSDLNKLRIIISDSNLPNKEYELMLVDVNIALIGNNSDSLDKATVQSLKNQVFNIEKFNEDNVDLYGNCMSWFDLDSNLIISKRIIDQFINVNDIKVQNKILKIIINVSFFCFENKECQKSIPLIEKAQAIATIPENYFYKRILFLLTNLIEYHCNSRKINLDTCKSIIKNISLTGMTEYAHDLEIFLKENI